MKHIFIINPKSGKGRKAKKFALEAEKYLKTHNLDGYVYRTQGPRDGMKHVEEVAKKGEPVRFYSCGGDGSLYEVVNGCYKYPNCEIANIPLGSGNDFSRLFGRNTNIDDHVNGIPVKLDLIETLNGEVSINECAMGVDSEVCAMQSDFKKLPFVSGELAYTLAAVKAVLTGKLTNHFRITIDGELYDDDDYLFCYIGNSRWYGGGYLAAPSAMPNDGLIECVMVKFPKELMGSNPLQLIPLLGRYKKGEHVEWDFTTIKRCKHVKVECTKPAAVNVDGECAYVTEREFKMLESKVTFVVHRGSPFLDMIK